MSLVEVVLGGAADGKDAIVLGGAAVLGVALAIKAVHWIQLILIEREASKEYYDRYGR